MNEETYKGWEAPVEESTEGAETVVDEQAAPEVVVNDEPEGESPGEETSDEEEQPDPLAEFRKDGKLFGRYDSEVEALKAFHSNDQERGRLAAEVGQLRQALTQTQAASTAGVDLDELAPLVGKMPSQIAQSQAFWDYAADKLDFNPPVDDDGYVDMSEVNAADLIEAVRSMKEYVANGVENRKVQDVMKQHTAVAEAFEVQFYAAHPDLQEIAPLVESVFNELYLSKKWTLEELDTALTEGVRNKLTKVAASVLGQRGGLATQEARRSPPGATGSGTPLGSPRNGPQSEEDKYRGWAPPSVVKEMSGKPW